MHTHTHIHTHTRRKLDFYFLFEDVQVKKIDLSFDYLRVCVPPDCVRVLTSPSLKVDFQSRTVTMATLHAFALLSLNVRKSKRKK